MSNRTNDAARPAEILLVEDNPGDVRLAREAFDQGHIENTLHVVTDGVEALEFVRRRGDYEDAPRPDLVLLDLNLPRKAGDEVLAELKGSAELKSIPVVVMTSSTADEDVAASYRNHANAYLTKPIDPHEFIDTIRSFEQFWLSVVRLPPATNDHD
jgi:CheY-like chemotaxis protein